MCEDAKIEYIPFNVYFFFQLIYAYYKLNINEINNK